jgi:hypothetical protein
MTRSGPNPLTISQKRKPEPEDATGVQVNGYSSEVQSNLAQLNGGRSSQSVSTASGIATSEIAASGIAASGTAAHAASDE